MTGPTAFLLSLRPDHSFPGPEVREHLTRSEEHQRADLQRTRRQVVAVNRGWFKRPVELAGPVLALELFMPGGTLIAVCVLFGGRHQAPRWVRKMVADGQGG